MHGSRSLSFEMTLLNPGKQVEDWFSRRPEPLFLMRGGQKPADQWRRHWAETAKSGRRRIAAGYP